MKWPVKSKVYDIQSFPGRTNGKEPACQYRRQVFDPWVRKIPWQREWQPSTVSLPGESQGPRKLVGYHPWLQSWTRLRQLNMHAQILTSRTLKWKKEMISYIPLHQIITFKNVTSFKYMFLATAAKSLQSCPTLCDPIDDCPPGCPVPGILQARTLEWVAISSPMHESEKLKWSRSIVSDS